MTALIAVCALVAVALLTALVRRRALERGVLDIPNERSSHSVPTPRGGGVAIVLVVSAAGIGLWSLRRIDFALLMALLGGLAVAAVGFIDDRHQLKAGPRLFVHLLAAFWVLVWLGGLPPVQLGQHLYSSGAAGYLLGVLGIVWVLNLFNFMDGIDALAASEGAFMTWGAALTAGVAAASDVAWQPAVVVGAACCGFLLWNWPPAKIFMGDVGSGYLGFILAVLALAATRTDPVALLVWLILGTLFWADATVTLLRRVLRGELAHAAHRSHAYQHLARRFGEHRRVTLLAIGINLCWLLPWAIYAELHPRWALGCVLTALLPLLALVFVAGAGRPERMADKP